MAGDGGNDCGGLRAAHAGLALSDAEARVGLGKDTRQPTGSCSSPVEVGPGSLSHYLRQILYIPGGCFGFLNHQQYDHGWCICEFWIIFDHISHIIALLGIHGDSEQNWRNWSLFQLQASMVAPFSTGRMGTGLWRAAGWKLQAAPHISLLCWVSYPLTGAAKNDISLTTVPDLIREGGKQCQTSNWNADCGHFSLLFFLWEQALALPGSMPPLLCHDSFWLCFVQNWSKMCFFARSSVFGHKYGNLHIFHGVCLLVDHSSLVAGSSVRIFFPFCCWPLASSELRTFYIILLNLSLGELGKPSVVGRFFPIGWGFHMWFFQMDFHVVQKVWSPETRPQVGGKAPLEEQMTCQDFSKSTKKDSRSKTQTATRWVWMTNDPTLAFTCSFGRFSPPSMW